MKVTVVGVGTPLWSNGFGCVTWLGEDAAGFALMEGGVPKIIGHAPIEQIAFWAARWLDVMAEDGRIEAVDTDAKFVV